MNILIHAKKVVDHFKSTLPESITSHLGQKHYDELALMINSAIETSVALAIECNAQEIENLANTIRRNKK